MTTQRLPLLVLPALALAAIAVPSLAAPKPKPVGYGYGQCTSKTKCAYQAFTNPSGKSLTFSASKQCQSASTAIGQIGAMKVSGGKFSKTVTKQAQDPKTQTFVSVKVQVKGTLKARKSVKGTLKLTTKASDCTKTTGKTQHFNMKYTGPIYGG